MPPKEIGENIGTFYVPPVKGKVVFFKIGIISTT